MLIAALRLVAMDIHEPDHGIADPTVTVMPLLMRLRSD